MKFDCPVCNKPGCSAYDSKEKQWRPLDFFQHKAFQHCRVPRASCDECGIHQIKIPWARETSGFSLLMDALIMSMAQSMQISEIADMIGEHDTRVLRVVKYYVEDARSREDFSNVSIIGIDETSSAKAHKFTLVMDFATSKAIHVCRCKDALTLSTFKEDHYDIPSIESLKVPTTHMK